MFQSAADGLTKAAMAVREGGHLKKVSGHLRYLFRNTANGRSEAVDELKKYLTKKKRSRASKVVLVGLTLQEAKAHCRREDTRKEGEWFDGYEKETK